MQFVPSEKTTTIRQPSTANLMVDSADRKSNYPLCNDFLISKPQSLMNGYFTRVGTTEVVFEWNTPNIGAGQYTITYTTNIGTQTTSITEGFYTQKEFLDVFVTILNNAALGYTFTVTPIAGGYSTISYAATSGTSFTLSGTAVDAIFGASPVINTDPLWVDGEAYIPFIDLRPARYIDIVCSQLTNNQSVKDASTSDHVRDVLCRWYFDYDNATPVDAYGYPILMGYTPFFLRRLYNPPKQIQWQANIPIGQLFFQLYNNNGQLQQVSTDTNYLMTLQMSEN